MIFDSEKISKNNQSVYGRISFIQQDHNSSLNAQKDKLIKISVQKQDLSQIRFATDEIQNRPIFFKVV